MSNKCPKQEGWGWDLRVSCRLYDGSGSYKDGLNKGYTSKVLQRNLAELVLLASSKTVVVFPAITIIVRLPHLRLL